MAFSQPNLLSSLFYKAVKNVDDVIKPVFNAAVSFSAEVMDKIGIMGKAGQALFDKPGMQYGGNNLVVSMQRQMRRVWRAKELVSLNFARS